MILVYGVPASYTPASLDSTLNWDKCVKSCYNTTTCIMAWQVKNACMKYNYDQMVDVTKTSSKNGSIVAFKVEVPSETCPVGRNPPTFNNKNATGEFYIAPTTYPLKITYTIYLDGDKWKTEYSVRQSCSNDLPNYFQRKDFSSLCYTTFIDMSNITTQGFNYTFSTDLCRGANSLPATFIHPEDAPFFMNLFGDVIYREALNRVGKANNTYVRMDGRRKDECESTPKTEACMSVKGFRWFGPEPANFNNYKWVTDSSAQETPDDNCIVMVWNETDPVKMDIRTCSIAGSPLPPKMILCAYQAWNF